MEKKVLLKLVPPVSDHLHPAFKANIDPRAITIQGKKFDFDAIYREQPSNQFALYEHEVKPLVNHFARGNGDSDVFVMGSSICKEYAMSGPAESPGILFRVLDHLFTLFNNDSSIRIQNPTLKMCMYQLSSSQESNVFDCLAPRGSVPHAPPSSSSSKPQLHKFTQVSVRSAQMGLELFSTARRMDTAHSGSSSPISSSAPASGAASSSSSKFIHTIIQFSLTLTGNSPPHRNTVTTLTLALLAPLDDSPQRNPSTNNWFNAVANVVVQLDKHAPSPHFHKSKICSLMKDWLCGTSKRLGLLLVTLSPSMDKLPESLAFLTLASRIHQLSSLSPAAPVPSASSSSLSSSSLSSSLLTPSSLPDAMDSIHHNDEELSLGALASDPPSKQQQQQQYKSTGVPELDSVFAALRSMDIQLPDIDLNLSFAPSSSSSLSNSYAEKAKLQQQQIPSTPGRRVSSASPSPAPAAAAGAAQRTRTSIPTRIPPSSQSQSSSSADASTSPLLSSSGLTSPSRRSLLSSSSSNSNRPSSAKPVFDNSPRVTHGIGSDPIPLPPVPVTSVEAMINSVLHRPSSAASTFSPSVVSVAAAVAEDVSSELRPTAAHPPKYVAALIAALDAANGNISKLKDKIVEMRSQNQALIVEKSQLESALIATQREMRTMKESSEEALNAVERARAARGKFPPRSASRSSSSGPAVAKGPAPSSVSAASGSTAAAVDSEEEEEDSSLQTLKKRLAKSEMKVSEFLLYRDVVESSLIRMRERSDALEAEKSQVDQALKKTEKKLANVTRECNELRRQLKEATLRINEEVGTAHHVLHHHAHEAASLRQEIASMKDLIQQQQEELAAQELALQHVTSEQEEHKKTAEAEEAAKVSNLITERDALVTEINRMRALRDREAAEAEDKVSLPKEQLSRIEQSMRQTFDLNEQLQAELLRKNEENLRCREHIERLIHEVESVKRANRNGGSQ